MVNHTVMNYVDMVLSHANVGGCPPLIDCGDIVNASIVTAGVVIITVLIIFALHLFW